MNNHNWSRSLKRAGIWFIHPDHGSSWQQDHKEVESPILREAIALSWKFFNETYARLEQEAKAKELKQ